MLLAGTPFESLTALREIEGVARPTVTLKTGCVVGSATALTKMSLRCFPRLFPRVSGSKETVPPVRALNLHVSCQEVL